MIATAGSVLLICLSLETAAPPVVEPRQLAERSLTGDTAAREALVALGPEVIPKVRDVFAARQRGREFTALCRSILRADLDRSARAEPGLRYHGQFKHLAGIGSEGLEALLGILNDDDVPIEVRTRAASALGDIGDASLIIPLEQIIDDFLTEEWLEREVCFLVARLGEERHVERMIAGNQKLLAKELDSQTLPLMLGAHTELAEIFYRIEDYGQAVKHYRQKRVLLVDLRDRVHADLRPAVESEIALLHYNLACSLSLNGEVPEALAALEIALGNPEVTMEMIQNDGDLRRLRESKEFPQWLRERSPREPAPEQPEKRTPPTETDRG